MDVRRPGPVKSRLYMYARRRASLRSAVKTDHRRLAAHVSDLDTLMSEFNGDEGIVELDARLL